MAKEKCTMVKGRGIVCGQLHAGGMAPKAGVYRLKAGEKVVSKTALNKLTKKHSTSKHKRKHKKCSCHHK
jgi:hypothetical protein